MCHEFGSDGDAVGDAAFDDGEGLISAVNGGLLAGVLGDVDECRGTGCGLSGILIDFFYNLINVIVSLIVTNSISLHLMSHVVQAICVKFHFAESLNGFFFKLKFLKMFKQSIQPSKLLVFNFFYIL